MHVGADVVAVAEGRLVPRTLLKVVQPAEAGVVRVADALDMAKGRSRISMGIEGTMSIHSISAAAIEAVHIESGVEKPVRIRVEMTNSAGIFQLDQLFREKLSGSGLENYVEVEALIEGEAEKRLVQTAYRI